MHDYAELFGSEGPLATAIPGFATREEQIAMAEQVALALRSHGRLIVEAADDVIRSAENQARASHERRKARG